MSLLPQPLLDFIQRHTDGAVPDLKFVKDPNSNTFTASVPLEFIPSMSDVVHFAGAKNVGVFYQVRLSRTSNLTGNLNTSKVVLICQVMQFVTEIPLLYVDNFATLDHACKLIANQFLEFWQNWQTPIDGQLSCQLEKAKDHERLQNP